MYLLTAASYVSGLTSRIKKGTGPWRIREPTGPYPSFGSTIIANFLLNAGSGFPIVEKLKTTEIMIKKVKIRTLSVVYVIIIIVLLNKVKLNSKFGILFLKFFLIQYFQVRRLLVCQPIINHSFYYRFNSLYGVKSVSEDIIELINYLGTPDLSLAVFKTGFIIALPTKSVVQLVVHSLY